MRIRMVCTSIMKASAHLDLQDARTLDGREKRAPPRLRSTPASILDLQFLFEKRDLRVGSIEFHLNIAPSSCDDTTSSDGQGHRR